MQSTQEKSSKVSVSPAEKLSLGLNNNFEAWRSTTYELARGVVNHVATVMATNVRFAPPPTVINPPEAAGLTPANQQRALMKRQEIRAALVASFAAKEPEFYAFLWARLSLGVQDKVRSHANYNAVSIASDGSELYLIIREVVLLNPNGGGAGMQVIDRRTAEMLYAKFELDSTMSIVVFKQKFTEWRIMLTALGVPVPAAAEEAADFLLRLDKGRWGSFYNNLMNDARRANNVLPLPATLQEAFELARDHQVTVRDPASDSMRTFTILANDYMPEPAGVKRQREADRGNSDGNRSGNKKLPRAVVAAADKKGGEAKRGKATIADDGTRIYDDSRTFCHICRRKGHFYLNCPSFDPNHVKGTKKKASSSRESAYVAVGEDDVEDTPRPAGGVYHSLVGCCLCVEEVAADSTNSMLNPPSGGEKLFYYSSTDFLLDNQAAKHIVHYRAAIHDVRDITPFTIGGVDGSEAGMVVTQAGSLRDLSGIAGTVGVHANAAANILSQARLRDAGHQVTYNEDTDEYYLQGDQCIYTFARKLRPDGSESCHYSCDMMSGDRVFIDTVKENMQKYTSREVKEATAARDLMERLGWPSTQGMINMLHNGMQSTTVTAQHVLRADMIFGKAVPGLKGKTVKATPRGAKTVLAPRVVQKQQILNVDLLFVKKIPFLVAVMSPCGMTFCTEVKDKSVESVCPAVRSIQASVAKRNFDIVELAADGEGALYAMKDELAAKGIALEKAGPGQHVATVERMNRTIKERVRSVIYSLPYIMTRQLLAACVLFCVICINWQPSRTNLSNISPMEQYSGRKLNVDRDMRFPFGSYVQATVPNTSNSMEARTDGGIYLFPTGNSTGSFNMLSLATNELIVRDQCKSLPMPLEVISRLNAKAERQGYTRGSYEQLVAEFAIDDASQANEDLLDAQQPAVELPDMMQLDDRPDVENTNEMFQPHIDESEAGVKTRSHQPESVNSVLQPAVESAIANTTGARRSLRTKAAAFFGDDDEDVVLTILSSYNGEKVPVLFSPEDHARFELRRQLAVRQDWVDKEFAFKISVKAALKELGDEARKVMQDEVQQMLDKKVWHGVFASDLSPEQRKKIIYSTMFLKKKFTASGDFEKLKARLVAGGNLQDRELYDNLSSPTAATHAVLICAAIAASEGRLVEVIDIGGAFLNADMAPTGILVHMRLDPLMTQILVKLDHSYQQYVESNGTLVVELDKALYGCVEAAALWYSELRSKLFAYGFVANEYDQCVFNKTGQDGQQITIVLHVDDLMVTSLSQTNIDDLKSYLRSVFPEITTHSGDRIDYIGMTFDFSVKGEVRVTMDNCVDDILSECGVDSPRMTPAASTLFDTREDAPKASPEEAAWFHTYTAKMLYLAKRVRPECLTAVAFLSGRVNDCDHDDLGKLRRLLGYLLGTRDRGIALKIGPSMTVSSYIDAAYGVHEKSGKSHTGCAIVIGLGGPVYAKSGKQKIVTKSSTEAELVALSDTATQALLLRNFVEAQGYDVGPAVIYQDNLSCMALMKRGRPASERSRHINIRYFWLAERVANGEVKIIHKPTKEMMANVLTKPVQGAQFVEERRQLTNWE